LTLLVFSAPRSGGQLHAAWQGVMLTVHQLSAIRSIQVNTLEWSGHTLGGKVTLGGAARVFRGTSSTTGAYMSCRTRVFFSTLSRSNRQTEADTERQRDCVCVCVCVQERDIERGRESARTREGVSRHVLHLRCVHVLEVARLVQYRGTSLIRKRLPLGPYSRPMHRPTETETASVWVWVWVRQRKRVSDLEVPGHPPLLHAATTLLLLLPNLELHTTSM